MVQCVPKYCAIDFDRWIGRCLLEWDNGQWYECYWLKLPSYGYRYQINVDREVWSQLVLFWHGRDGLRTFWLPSPQGDKP